MPTMRAWIGISQTQKTIELEMDDVDEFRRVVEEAAPGSVLWLTDVKDRLVGIPADKLAYIEIEAEGTHHTVGFGPGS
ncbi:MAG: DUF3107 family protein [Acidimicrobiia bacterium]|nr:DUF3107 family protein [Acidimicrobiia bacterium]